LFDKYKALKASQGFAALAPARKRIVVVAVGHQGKGNPNTKTGRDDEFVYDQWPLTAKPSKLGRALSMGGRAVNSCAAHHHRLHAAEQALSFADAQPDHAFSSRRYPASRAAASAR
jgi:hypothetical protein